MIDFSAYPPLVERTDDNDLAAFTPAQVAAACDDVRGACGWHVAPRYAETFHIDSDGSTILTLPSLLITEPTSVTTADGTPITDYEWSEIGQLTRANRWPNGFRTVIVTVEHGFVTAPPALRAVIVHMLTAAAGAPVPGSKPVKTITHDGATIGYGEATPSGPASDVMRTYGHVLRRIAL